jgi:hypothetical protein
MGRSSSLCLRSALPGGDDRRLISRNKGCVFRHGKDVRSRYTYIYTYGVRSVGGARESVCERERERESLGRGWGRGGGMDQTSHSHGVFSLLASSPATHTMVHPPAPRQKESDRRDARPTANDDAAPPPIIAPHRQTHVQREHVQRQSRCHGRARHVQEGQEDV